MPSYESRRQWKRETKSSLHYGSVRMLDSPSSQIEAPRVYEWRTHNTPPLIPATLNGSGN